MRSAQGWDGEHALRRTTGGALFDFDRPVSSLGWSRFAEMVSPLGETFTIPPLFPATGACDCCAPLLARVHSLQACLQACLLLLLPCSPAPLLPLSLLSPFSENSSRHSHAPSSPTLARCRLSLSNSPCPLRSQHEPLQSLCNPPPLAASHPRPASPLVTPVSSPTHKAVAYPARFFLTARSSARLRT
jgi:hypothetical protein